MLLLFGVVGGLVERVVVVVFVCGVSIGGVVGVVVGFAFVVVDVVNVGVSCCGWCW